MPTNILMPALSPTMEKGTLARWLKKEGDVIKSGDILAEIETDKATMEVEAVEEGILAKITVADGTADVPVNQVIGIMAAEGEDPGQAGDAKPASPPPPKSNGVASDAPTDGEGGAKAVAKPDETPSAPTGLAPPTRNDAAPDADGAKAGAGDAQPAYARVDAAPPGAVAEKGKGDGGRLFASPLARRIAKEAGLDLAGVKGSGPHGRIVQADVKRAAESGPEQVPAKPATPPPAAEKAEETPASPATEPPSQPKSPAQPKAPAPALAAGFTVDQVKAMYEAGSYEEVALDGMRKTVARRLTESKQTVPHFYLSLDVGLDALLALREQVNAGAPKDKEGKPAFKLSVNDFVIKALALALQRVPDANAVWAEDRILKFKSSDVGVAVAVEGGLFTPVIRRADSKTLSAISAEMKDLAARARKRRLKPEEYTGGSTAVSNLGMYGITSFGAVINPPHGTILAVGVGEKRVVVKGDVPAVATVMTVTLSVDHRTVDGALGAELLAAFKALVEAPMTMLV